MGILRYDETDYEFDDRLLAHLQIVISTKLRRSESFFVNWRISPDAGSGRGALWIDNGMPIHFFFNGSRMPAINRDWVESMMLSASSATGLHLTDEPVAKDQAAQRP